ncbi:MAG: hypothetical protein IJ057_13070 [Bacteroidales bacterium]|nr:hypothetical protein [Bacteroidales bacterium]
MAQLPVGDFYRFGLYAVKLLAQVFGGGGKTDNVPGTGSLAVLTGFESGKDCDRVRPSPCFSRCGPRRWQCLQRASCGRSEYETQPLASRICLSGWRDPFRRGTP